MVPRVAVRVELEWDVRRRKPPEQMPVLGLLTNGDSLVVWWNGYDFIDDRSIGYVRGAEVIRWKYIKWHLD